MLVYACTDTHTHSALTDICTLTAHHPHLCSPAVTFEGQGPAGKAGFERSDEVKGWLDGGAR